MAVTARSREQAIVRLVFVTFTVRAGSVGFAGDGGQRYCDRAAGMRAG